MDLKARFFAKLLAEGEWQQCLQAWQAGASARPAWVLAPGREQLQDFCADESSPRPQWLPPWVLLPAKGIKAGAHEDYVSGAFYPLDLSSVWESMVLADLPLQQSEIIDVCAAPGGKSVLAARHLQPQAHYANELVNKRLGILRANMNTLGMQQVQLSNLQTSELAERHAGRFDVVIVDAPCSGQSLPAKGIEAPGCFHASVINGNALRQRKILGYAQQLVKPGGYLMYSTCMIGWLCKQHRDFKVQSVPLLQQFASPLADFALYRLYPHQGLGSGGTVCLLRRDA